MSVQPNYSSCQVLCWLGALIAGIILGTILYGAGVSSPVSFIIGLIAFLLLGWLLSKFFCSGDAAHVAAPAATASAAAAAPKAAAPKPAAPKPAAKPAAKKSSGPKLYTERPSEVDDLKLISGVGPKMEKMVNKIGVYQFSQIASWKKADVDHVDSLLDGFHGRIARDEWVKQAKVLAKGGETEFSKRNKKK